jgi:hypothetical protein
VRVLFEVFRGMTDQHEQETYFSGVDGLASATECEESPAAGLVLFTATLVICHVSRKVKVDLEIYNICTQFTLIFVTLDTCYHLWEAAVVAVDTT